MTISAIFQVRGWRLQKACILILIPGNLVEWSSELSRFVSRLKLAYLTEEYRYFDNYEIDSYTYGNVNTAIARYDLTYDISNDIKLNAIADYTQSTGEGSDIINKKRDIGSGSLLMKHSLTDSFEYELGVRKEITNVYESPLLFSLGASYSPSKYYTLKLNASRNFRIPTFNDLYWVGAGNPDLNPETSYQAEIGNVFNYKDATLTITGYYIKLDNMLRWVPGSGSAWSPENIFKARSYGAEALFSWHKGFGKNNISVEATYAYTESHREGQSEQLIYVPYHKATASVAYTYKNISAYYTHLVIGEVFTTSDNSSKLDPYNVSNLGVEYHIKFLQGLDIGVQVLNLWDEEYENVAMRPMPGRHYNTYINFKF
jgi:vitamin B12 transporter